jgi:hypothetical protein
VDAHAITAGDLSIFDCLEKHHERREPRSWLAKRPATARVGVAGGSAGTTRARRTHADGRWICGGERSGETRRKSAQEGRDFGGPQDHGSQEDRREEASSQADRAEEDRREEARRPEDGDRAEEDHRAQEDRVKPHEKGDTPAPLEEFRVIRRRLPVV